MKYNSNSEKYRERIHQESTFGPKSNSFIITIITSSDDCLWSYNRFSRTVIDAKGLNYLLFGYISQRLHLGAS